MISNSCLWLLLIAAVLLYAYLYNGDRNALVAAVVVAAVAGYLCWEKNNRAPSTNGGYMIF